MERGELSQSGVYKISSITHPDRFYIGSAAVFYKRWSDHRRGLAVGNHPNIILQRHYDKYGPDDLVYEIVSTCDRDELLDREQRYIDALNPFFNISKVTRSPMLGLTVSEENKKKLGERMKGKRMALGYRFTEEQRMRVSDGLRGRVVSDETKEKIGAANRGRKQAPETTRRNSELRLAYYKTHPGSRLGQKASDETRRKLSEARRGMVYSDETKLKMSRAHMGRVKSAETKERMRKPKTPQAIENMKAAWVLRKLKYQKISSNG